MDDVFDEEADELTVNKNEYNKIMENIEKDGYIDGIDEGKQNIIQESFNKGYEIAFKYVYKINMLKGILSAHLSIDKDKVEQLKQLNEKLINLEKQVMDDLIEYDKKEYTDIFNIKMNEIENQLIELNLIKNLDSLFKDE